jgi:hypothetical protein
VVIAWLNLRSALIGREIGTVSVGSSSDSRTAAKRILLDHLAGAGEHGGGMVKPRFGIDIDPNSNLVRCRTEMVCKLFTFQTLRSAGLVYFVA